MTDEELAEEVIKELPTDWTEYEHVVRTITSAIRKVRQEERELVIQEMSQDNALANCIFGRGYSKGEKDGWNKAVEECTLELKRQPIGQCRNELSVAIRRLIRE